VLIAAPPAVVVQWVEEIRRWAPGLSVGVAGSSDVVTKSLGRCDVVVGSSQVVGAWALTSRRRVPLLVVDEAATLIRSSRTSRGLWRLREFADAAWALSGSPEERGSRGGVGRLLAWSRGVAVLPDLPADEFGPLLVGHWRASGQEQGGGVPRLRSAALVCPSEQRFEFAAPSKLSGLAAVNATESLRASLAGDPARQAAVAGVISEHVRQGGRTLVFANSASALSSLVDRLSAAGVPARMLPSATDRVERVGVLSAFAAGSVSVLAVTPASQRGVNLQQADLVVHLDLPASRSEMRQRSGRAVRIGSPHVEVTELLCALPGSVEEAAVRRLLAGNEPAFP
jgi:superfamily II DNA or RNA helicase